MMNRRRLFTSLGATIGGGLLVRATPVFGQPQNPCAPKPGAVNLAVEGLYKSPTSQADAETTLKKAFLKGVTTADKTLTPLPSSVVSHLKAGYRESLEEKITNKDFMEDAGKPAAQWIALVDYAFILGQLAVYFRRDDPKTGKKGPVRPRDVVRAQSRIRRATSSAECACYIDQLKAYQLPAGFSGSTSGDNPKKQDDPCNTAGGSPGPIDSECPLCG